MPTNRVDCSMTRLLCLRLHARPSGATLDHRHIAMTGHPFRSDTDMRSPPSGPHSPLFASRGRCSGDFASSVESGQEPNWEAVSLLNEENAEAAVFLDFKSHHPGKMTM